MSRGIAPLCGFNTLETHHGLEAVLPALRMSELGELPPPSTSTSRLPRILPRQLPLLQWSWLSSGVDPSVNSCAHLDAELSLCHGNLEPFVGQVRKMMPFVLLQLYTCTGGQMLSEPFYVSPVGI